MHLSIVEAKQCGRRKSTNSRMRCQGITSRNDEVDMDKKTMKLVKQLMFDAYSAEMIEAAKEAVKKEVSKSVKEGEEHDRRRN